MTKIVKGLEIKIMKAILAHDSHNADWNIELLENGGVVALTGTVSSLDEVKLVESIALEQDGVLTVINEIRVEDSGDSSVDNIQIAPLVK